MPGIGWFSLFRSVVALAEILLQPTVQCDEQITASHFLNAQFGFAGAAVTPRDRYDGPGKAAHDDLQRQLHGKVEVRRKERAAAVDRAAAVCLECIGEVIERHDK